MFIPLHIIVTYYGIIVNEKLIQSWKNKIK